MQKIMAMFVEYEGDDYEFEGSACLIDKNGDDSLHVDFFKSDIESLVRQAEAFVKAVKKEGEEK